MHSTIARRDDLLAVVGGPISGTDIWLPVDRSTFVWREGEREHVYVVRAEDGVNVLVWQGAIQRQ